jgi:Tfp pilus assembly protein PilN
MNEIDFLPERIRLQRQRRTRLKRQGGLLVLCLLAMVGLSFAGQHRIAEAKADLASTQEHYRNIQSQIALIPPLEKQMADLLIKKRIDGELGSRTDCTALLAELCRVMPANVSLLSLEMQSADSKPGGKTNRADDGTPTEAVKRVRLVFEGLAPTDVDIANFIGQLSSSCLFEGVNMSYSKSVPFHGRVAREFQASCYLAK